MGRVSQEEIRKQGELILLEKPNLSTDFALLHSVLCQVGLPRTQVDGIEYMTGNHRAWLSIRAGKLDEGSGPVQQIIPYGPIPRLALAWVSTYARRHKTREIPIGDSAAEFLRLMGMKNDGGRRYIMLRKQMHALAACNLQLGSQGRNFQGQPVEQFDAWVADKENTNRALWPGVMRLSHNYYESLIESGVPLDNRALMALSGSSLALDVYAFLAYRLHHLSQSTRVSWQQLGEQFGMRSDGKSAVYEFQRTFKAALQKTLLVYPQADVRPYRGGIELFPSPPPIAKKQVAVS